MGVVIGAVILIVAAVYALPLLSDDHKSGAQERREECLYAAVKQYPEIKLKEGEQIYGKIDECQDLSTRDKVIVRDMMVAFVESAFTNAGN